MSGKQREACPLEQQIIRDAYEAKWSARQIVGLLADFGFCCGERFIYQQVRAMGLRRRDQAKPLGMDKGIGNLAVMNRKFREAMLAARRNKTETVHIGVHKDFSPFTGKRFQAEPNHSGYGSSAALCAEL